jgi:imidazolonepropionase-like amidohydrolase
MIKGLAPARGKGLASPHGANEVTSTARSCGALASPRLRNHSNLRGDSRPMKTRRLTVSAALLGFAWAMSSMASAAPARQLIHAGALIDGIAETPRREVTIVVEKERIVEVVPGYRQPGKDEQVIDLKSQTVLPGFIDMHVHLGVESSPQAYIERFTLNPADVALRAAHHARLTLRAGFTTVRNLGDHANVTVSLREAIRRGYVEGPRIFTAGKSLATTGGHADPSNGWADLIEGDPGPKEGVLNGAAESAKAVRQRYKDGADLIKITATGGVLSLARSPHNPQFTEEEIRAVVVAARDYDFPVAAHCHGAEGMKRAIRAGVNSIEHGTLMDDEVIQLMRQHGTYLVPTLSAGRFVAEKSKVDGYYPEVVRPKAAAIGPQIDGMFAKAAKAGIKIAFGTDAGVSPHGENGKEFVFMVENGMKPMDAIKAATVEAAKLLRRDSELGSVEAGKFADLVAVPRDPLVDISALLEVSFVMKAGAVFDVTRDR